MKFIEIMKNIMNELIKPKEQANEFHTTWEDDYIGNIEYDDVLECGCCACCGCTCYDPEVEDEKLKEVENDH